MLFKTKTNFVSSFEDTATGASTTAQPTVDSRPNNVAQPVHSAGGKAASLAFQPGPAKDEDVSVNGFEPLIKYPVIDGKVNVYQSTKSGSRFVFKQHEFNEPNSNWGLFGDTKATLKIDLDNVNQVKIFKKLPLLLLTH